MIIDVHTHTPRYRDAIPTEAAGQVNTKWSTGKTIQMAYTWDDFRAALEPVDRAIVFNIAADPRNLYEIDEPYIVPVPAVNDETAAFVNAYPEKYLGFVTVHPHDPRAIEEIERGTQDFGLQGHQTRALTIRMSIRSAPRRSASTSMRRRTGCRSSSTRAPRPCASRTSTARTRATWTGSGWPSRI